MMATRSAPRPLSISSAVSLRRVLGSTTSSRAFGLSVMTRRPIALSSDVVKISDLVEGVVEFHDNLALVQRTPHAMHELTDFQQPRRQCISIDVRVDECDVLNDQRFAIRVPPSALRWWHARGAAPHLR